MLADIMAIDTGLRIEFLDTKKYEPLMDNLKNAVYSVSDRPTATNYYEERGIGNNLKNSPARSIYYTADMVAEMLGISIDKSYKIIRSLNEQLDKQGYIIIAGRVPKKYFQEKFFGLSEVAHLFEES